jgi:hypothetical protein
VSRKPLAIALEEIVQDKIVPTYVEPEEGAGEEEGEAGEAG